MPAMQYFSKEPRIFKNLKEINLSCNRLTQFPLILGLCTELREIRLINNMITTIPTEFTLMDNVKSNLHVLILNANPIKQITE